MIFATFTFEGAALVWWQLKKPLEPLWLWPRFLEVFNEEYFSETVKDQKITEFLNLTQRNMTVAEYNAKFQQLKLPTFQGTPDPMATKSWLLGIEKVFKVLPCTDEQNVILPPLLLREPH